MRHIRVAVLLGLVLTLTAAPAVMAGGDGSHGRHGQSRSHAHIGFHTHHWWNHGILPSWVRVGGHSMSDYAGDFDVWFLSNADDSPTLNPRCEQSPLNHKVWYLPVSIGGDVTVSCDIPRGSFLLLMSGSAECSDLEAPPWYGGNAAELRACVNEQAAAITDTSITIDGWTTHNLDRHLIRSGVVNMPANNLLSPDAGISMIKGYFVMLLPLRRGHHTLAGWVEFGTDFAGGVTYEINIH